MEQSGLTTSNYGPAPPPVLRPHLPEAGAHPKEVLGMPSPRRLLLDTDTDSGAPGLQICCAKKIAFILTPAFLFGEPGLWQLKVFVLSSAF